jgi:undecaprenyl-diphosphatase
MSGALGWLEAITIGALQGVTELFPVSSLGHSVLLPALVGGEWARALDVSAPESPYLAYIVGLHVATAIALIVYFRRDWMRIVGGLVTSIARREVRDADQRLAWLLILATIPVGISGLLLEHLFRTVLSRPIPAASFLVVNGVVLLLGEALVGRTGGIDASPAADGVPITAEAPSDPGAQTGVGEAVQVDRRLGSMPIGRAVLIGSAQIAALLPGISRSGAAMVAGMGLGLSRADATRFSFLLATPVILAAGLLKLGDLFGPLGDSIRPQILVGSVFSGVAAYLSVRFLSRYVENRSLRPFGYYCIAFGLASLLWLAIT